ncbi:MAG: hypothetical protein KC496_13405, partial [Anaerolineae bacterium]|nr:hypothetical protein [Anaerolineae bacterium]
PLSRFSRRELKVFPHTVGGDLEGGYNEQNGKLLRNVRFNKHALMAYAHRSPPAKLQYRGRNISE